MPQKCVSISWKEKCFVFKISEISLNNAKTKKEHMPNYLKVVRKRIKYNKNKTALLEILNY